MQLIRFILTVVIFNIFYNITSAQAELCDGCYVWEFVNDKGERDETTRLLSNDIEDILSQYPDCKVLQRVRYAKLQEQINNEKAIQSLNNATAQVKTELKTIQAKRVIFGTASRDFQGNIILRLSFENLSTTQIKSSSAFISGEEYYNFDKRKQKLIAFINSFINPDGKLPSPGGDPKPQSEECSRDNMPFQKEVGSSTRIELCQCYFYNKKITCPFIVKNLTDTPLRFTLNVNNSYGISRLIIDYGTEYIASIGKFMSYSSDNWVYLANLPVSKNGVPAQLIFSVLELESKIIESLEIPFGVEGGGYKAVFTDIPLIYGPPPSK